MIIAPCSLILGFFLNVGMMKNCVTLFMFNCWCITKCTLIKINVGPLLFCVLLVLSKSLLARAMTASFLFPSPHSFNGDHGVFGTQATFHLSSHVQKYSDSHVL
ncbi:hypothetical protein XELAEV_18025028mg [Xenopus laevis]|uniref:Uncharacterized protein n=1 Tax=Xenopus laevis TaxID=8355 RepID=A0A974D1G1_XENLA|nr:hypothetical protein XELAEV_18025028mg [Xenopus laevis]